MKQQRRLLPTRRKTLTDNSNNSNKTRNNFASPVTKPFAMEVEGTSSAVDALLLLRHSKERVPSPPKPTLSPLPKEEESTIVTPESTSSSAAVTTAAPTPKTTKRTPKPKRPYEPADDTPKGPKSKRRPSMSKKSSSAESSSSKTNKKQTTTPPVSNWCSGEGARPPTKKDAVFGRGGLNNNMRNGTIFRELVEAHWEDYMRIHQIEIKEKRDFVYQNLMNPIVEQAGRFLVREGGFWRELSPDNAHDEKEIVKKIQQALRDEKKKHTPLAYTVAKQAVKEQQQQQALKASS